MDALAKVRLLNSGSQEIPNAIHFIQGNRKYLFFNNPSVNELSTYLQARDDLIAIVVNNCHFDTPLFVKLQMEYLEFLILTKCRWNIMPSLENMPNLAYLEISFNSLVEFPYDLKILPKLTVLRLTNNQISTLPPEIASLENLQVLDLSQNRLSHLPAEICNLRNLKYLDCSLNALIELPNNISNLCQLEVIHLNQNKLTCLPNSLSHLKRLQKLNLRSNHFEYMPFCIFECCSLKELVFSCNQALGTIPENVCLLSNLEILFLANNKFKKLPKALSSLTNLRILDVSHNDIEHIPEEILIKCTNLTQLNLCSCKLNELPESLGLCQSLQVLNISHNSIKSFPQNGADLKNLVSLDISENNISIIPEWVCELKKLSHVSVSRNIIEDLPDVFEEIARQLRILDVSQNQFEQLPRCILPKDAKLTYLQIDNNPILNIPPEISNLQFLTHLSISNCPYIFELPDDIGYLPKLRALVLSSNSLLKLPPTLHNLDNLDYLDLSDNKFSRFPIVVCFIPYLKVLLYNNCCHSCTYSEPDPPGWFERTSFIDPTASAEKLGKSYIHEADDCFLGGDDGPKLTLEEALASEEEHARLQSVKADEIGDLVFKQGPHAIPKLIHYLKFLVNLSLQQNGLYFLPEVFHKFAHLERVHLSDNNLRKIPCSLAFCRTLTHIDLKNNKLTGINAPIYKLSNLEHLELSGNNFPISLSEMITRSSLKSLCEYLTAQEETSHSILREMCRRLVDIVDPDDWSLIAQRLGLQKDTLMLIDRAMPGDKNFRRRVTRALEYWSGFAFSEDSLQGDTPVLDFPVSKMNLPNPSSKSSTTEYSNKAEENEKRSYRLTSTQSIAEDSKSDQPVHFPFTLHINTRVAGPKASPDRLIHILKLLDKNNLQEAMTAILAKSHIRLI